MSDKQKLLPNSYWDYIQLDTLLSIQRPKTEYEDEKVFIIYHQITELVFKLMLNELEQVVHCAISSQNKIVEDKFKRLNEYSRLLIDSFEIMRSGMSYEDYNNFRHALSPASGFQSVQFRIIELHCTSSYNLTSREFKTQYANEAEVKVRECFQNMYWQQAFEQGMNHKKSETLDQFEKKYLKRLIYVAKELRYKNVFVQINQANDLSENLVLELKKFDHFFNVLWPLTHYKTAIHYLNTPASKSGTGGSDWGKYLLPENQKRIFFPNLWNAQELENWGKEVTGA